MSKWYWVKVFLQMWAICLLIPLVITWTVEHALLLFK